MLFQEVSDIEEFLKSLKSDVKTQVTANINFLIINYLSQQKNLDPYSFIDKFASMLTLENKAKLNSVIDAILVAISPEKEKNLIKQRIAKITTEQKPSSDMLPESKAEQINIQSLLVTKSITLQSDENISTELKGNQKTKLQEYESMEFEFTPVIEGLKHIKAEITEQTKEELLKFGFEVKLYATLKTFYDEDTLYSLYKNHFENVALIDFIVMNILNLEKNKYLTFKKKFNYPGIVFRLKIGQFLLSMGKITQKELDIAINIQNKEAIDLKDNKVTESGTEKKRLLGQIIRDLNYITTYELEATVEIQKWYNNLFS